MQNFRFIGAMVSEFRFFKKKKKKMKKKKNMDNLIKSCLPVFWTSYDIFIHFSACYYMYIDDLLTLNNPKFLKSIRQIYPHELGLKKTTKVLQTVPTWI